MKFDSSENKMYALNEISGFLTLTRLSSIDCTELWSLSLLPLVYSTGYHYKESGTSNQRIDLERATFTGEDVLVSNLYKGYSR